MTHRYRRPVSVTLGVLAAFAAAAASNAEAGREGSASRASPIPAVATKGPTIIALAAPDRGAALRAGDVVELCAAPSVRLRSARVVAVSCRRRAAACAALVEIDPRRALPVLAAYDPARPPAVARSGAC